MQDGKLVETNTELRRISKFKLYETAKPTLPTGIHQEVKELKGGNKLQNKPDLSYPSNPTKSAYSIFH